FGMLPKGPLGKAMRRHLKVYAGPDHPHASQVVGSERAIEARKQAQAEALDAALASPPKPPRLRPFNVSQGAAATEDAEAAIAADAPAAVAPEAAEEPRTPAPAQ